MNRLSVKVSAPRMSGSSVWSLGCLDCPAKAPDGERLKGYFSSLLGDITATVNKTTIFNADPTQEMVNEKLREKASELGADAVILVRYGNGGMSLMSWGSLEGKGRAVKFVQ